MLTYTSDRKNALKRLKGKKGALAGKNTCQLACFRIRCRIALQLGSERRISALV